MKYMMKSGLILILLAVLLVFGAVGCSQPESSDEQVVGQEQEQKGDEAGAAEELPLTISQDDWVSHKQEIDLPTGINMKYVEMGQEDGEALILLHGMTDNSRSWSLIAPMFTEDYHVYMLDQRGHGDTDKPDVRMYSVDDYASDLAAFMDAKNIEKAHVVGHSLGSMIAQTFAVNYPEKVERMVLVAAAPVEFDSLGSYVYDSVLAFGDDNPDDEFMAAWYENPNPVDEEFLENEMRESQNIPIHAWRAIAKGCGFSDLTPFIEELKAETLILWGDIDGFFGEDIQNRLQDMIPHAEFIAYEGIGHNIQWENTEKMGEDILEFLAK